MNNDWVDKFNERKGDWSTPDIEEIEKDLEVLKERVMNSEASKYIKGDAKVVVSSLPKILQKCEEVGLLEHLSENYLAFATGINREITKNAFTLLKEIGDFWVENCMEK